jgi:autophagy-related protein 17
MRIFRCGDAPETGGHADGGQKTIRSLDEASARLNDTLTTLRNTMVDPAFGQTEGQNKVLFDFVDEVGVNDLYDSIKQSMDNFEVSRKNLSATCDAFDDDVDKIHEAIDPDDNDAEKSQTFTLDGISPIPSLFNDLENHATEVASHLEGLVKHYDLCRSALQHTEGGGEAISKASQGEARDDESRFAGFGLGITRLDEETAPEPVDDDDRASMLAIVVKDAGQVDEVVDEIRDRLAEMEDGLAQIQAYIASLRRAHRRLTVAVKAVKAIVGRVQHYGIQCAVFQASWEEERGVLATKMDEIESLTEFYSGFARGYDGLIVEVQRRRNTRREMDKIIRHAMGQVEKLYNGTFLARLPESRTDRATAEVERREEFKAEQGEYLPSDIWPGLAYSPVKYKVTPVGDEARSLPELKKEVVEQAYHRLTTKYGPQ